MNKFSNFKNLFLILIWIVLTTISVIISWALVGLIIWILGSQGLVMYVSSSVSVGLGALGYRWIVRR